jgi:hypothetical protein
VEGHGPFYLGAWKQGLGGPCTWRRHRGPEATRLWLETGQVKGLMPLSLMDRQADEQAWFVERQRQRPILVLTTTRTGQDNSPKRQRLLKVLQQPKHTRLDKPRSATGEPMQGVVKDIFA